MIPWLGPDEDFPPVSAALRRPNGLLAASEEIHSEQLARAYSHGIFPWYSQDEPVLWWSPDPRMVLYPAEFFLHRSLRKTLNKACRPGSGIEIVLDQDFEAVMRACAEPRAGQPGTWITEAVIAAYVGLHKAGLAHSIETRIDGELVGGLYGVSLGRMFYGESMFARATDASKIALAALVALLQREEVVLIDCQQATTHLASLGGRTIARSEFCRHLESAIRAPAIAWKAYAPSPLNALLSPG